MCIESKVAYAHSSTLSISEVLGKFGEGDSLNKIICKHLYSDFFSLTKKNDDCRKP